MKTSLIDIRSSGAHRDSFTERVWKGRVEIQSRSGLNATEKALIERLPGLRKSSRVLVLGNRTGVVAMLAAECLEAADVEVICLDIHHALTVERNLARNGGGPVVRVRCQPHIGESEVFDLVLFQVTRGSMTGELMEDFLQQVHVGLKDKGRLLIALDVDNRRIAERVKELFSGCAVELLEKELGVISATKQKKLKKIRNFEAGFEMTLPGKKSVALRTLPGIFSHRRLDEGALALAEVVETRPGDTLLDMGCGCGAIGIALAANESLEHVTFVDSNVRAMFITEQNARANGLEHFNVDLSDQGPSGDRKYSLIVGNPPYFADYTIAELFIRIARERVLPGGRVYMVAKNAERHSALMKEFFGQTEILRRRGYEIARSIA
ncbi:MAG: methyltransferase [Lentisphaerota bacterium]